MSKYRAKTEQIVYDAAFPPKFGGGSEDKEITIDDLKYISIPARIPMYPLRGDLAGYYLAPTSLLNDWADDFCVFVAINISHQNGKVNGNFSLEARDVPLGGDKHGEFVGGYVKIYDYATYLIDEIKDFKISQDFFLCSENYFRRLAENGDVGTESIGEATYPVVSFRDKIIWNY